MFYFIKIIEGKSNSSNDSTSSNNRSSSDEDNKKSAISQPAEKNLSKPQDDGTPSKIKFSIQSDACLWTKGPHGLLICEFILCSYCMNFLSFH